MDEDLSPLLKNLPPKTYQALQHAILRYSERRGRPSDWVQRWIGFVVVGDALTRHHIDGRPAFELKGGAAIELRILEQRGKEDSGAGLTPRATKDLDAVFRGANADINQHVSTALVGTRQPFTARSEAEHVDARMVRFRVRVGYTTTRFNQTQEYHLCSVKLEVSRYEGTVLPSDDVKSFSLAPFGIEGPDSLPCMSLDKQVAQKLHAMTAPPAIGKSNDRFRDLVDLVILSAMAPASQELRACCVETFAIRAMHDWPPTVAPPEHWREPVARLAKEIGLEISSIEDLTEHVTLYIQAIEGAE